MNIFDKIADTFGKSQDGESGLQPIANAVEQTPEERELVGYVRKKIDQVRQTNSRIAQEGIMFTNIAYLLGFDGVYYDTTYRQFRNVDPKRRLSRSRFKINKVLPTIQNRLARLCQTPPKYDIRPNSNSSEDKDCARLGLHIIENLFDKQNFTEKQQELLMCAMQGGVSYLQVLWDPMLGKPMSNPDSEEFAGYEGDIRFEVLNMLEVFPDPLAKNLDDAQWVIKAKVRKLDYFKEHYKERGDAVKEEDVWLLSSIYDLKSNAMSAVGIVGAQTNEQMRNSAIELVLYEKRSKDYPNGRMVVCASGILLEDKELPIGEFDIIKFDDVLIGGRYHSEGIITHLRPIQDQYNILRSKCADWIKKTLGGKFVAPKGHGMNEEALNNDSGEVIEYNPVPNAPGGGQPTAMVIPMIPQYVYEDIKVLSEEFDFVSGINDATRGVAPSASMPFRGMQLLVEQDQTRISVQTNRNEVGYAKIGSAALKYVGKYYEMPRLLKVAGDGLGYAVQEFMGQDLKGNYDVIVIPGSTIPNSKTLKRQDILNAYQIGLLGDVADPKLRAKVLKIMEFGDVSEMWKEQALDEQMIKKVIKDVEEGRIPEPIGHEWDNHGMFVQEINQYRKTDKFNDLSDKQKGALNYIAEWHLQALVNIQNPGLAQQQLTAQHMVNTMNNMKASGQLPQPAPSNPLRPPPPQPTMPNQPGGMPEAMPPMGA